MLGDAGLDVGVAEIACRESRKPHLQVVLGIADKPHDASSKKKRAKGI
jgi:ArsR family transcriptional regulator